MGNSLLQINSQRAVRAPGDVAEYGTLKKSSSLREYSRSTSLITSCINNNNIRRNISISRPKTVPPTDAEIIDTHALRCEVSSSDKNEGEQKLLKQLDYIHSCVRKDKGLLGMMTENLQNKHIFSNDEPENTHTLDQTPDEYNMDYESIYLQTPDGEFIHAYWIYQTEDVDSTMTVLYFHGAGGNISHRLEVLRLFYENLRCNILIIDYRGFGKSSGVPSELGVYIDAQTAYDYLIYKQAISPENIIVLGTSLGASVAIQLVSDPLNQVKFAIFENAFISVPEIAKYFLTYAKSVIGITKSIGFLYLFDSLPKVRRIECPCVYLAGLLDPMIPPWMSNTLYNETRSASKRQLFEYPFGKHNDLPIMKDYFENIQTFIDELPLKKLETEQSVLR
ncbi:unnamed protein product [Rotaria socialis]|uniref:Protein ABHD13 n=2 Tax=Rotaria socialis TaxID=392032 RepID=A0A818VFK6_9BILA|nr:unnamed protein product [Rotaria socialis]CAF3712081.1 unnamed protein product [Rotaria socialis]CAF3768128.1 unnamed protein product [Rotaria socialis]CAF4217347.1 unnamed protein product [Rotaria socialis]CAF4603389.1 unnamed protein product [Rotaria socialis]